jgi:hypothetical protein
MNENFLVKSFDRMMRAPAKRQMAQKVKVA